MPLAASQHGPCSYKGTAKFVLILLFSFLVLFATMSLRPNLYDEGIVLTAAMRVAAGQVPHRDFYVLYGPAEFYILAGVFKQFGESILVERLLDLLFRALVVASVYTIVSGFVRKSVAALATFATLLWLLGLSYATAGSAVVPVSFFVLISTWLLIQIFTEHVSRRRMFAVGMLTATGALFRYDTGIILFGVHVCIVLAATWLRSKDQKMFAFIARFWPYLIGFAVIALPPAICFLSISSVQPFIHDIIIFPSKYYYRARNLPFPGIRLKSLDNLAIYLPIVAVCISLYYCLGALSLKEFLGRRTEMTSEKRKLWGFLFAFALLTLGMYLKGFVRTSTIHIYLATIPSLLVFAALFEQRYAFRAPVRMIIISSAFLSLLSPLWCSLREARDLRKNHISIPENVWSSLRGNVSKTRKIWCTDANAATKGLCFLPDDDTIHAAEFIDAHTRPNDKIFVGAPKHDRIFANNMLLYFASQRMPATRWAGFDPDLQNRADIQTQMIRELELTVPPYVIIDSEFDQIKEPNDSSRSTGVTLLDDYIHKNYRSIQTFGTISIWELTPPIHSE